MQRRMSVMGRLALTTFVAVVVTTAANAQPAAPESMRVDTTHVDSDAVRQTTVIAGDARITVSRQVGKRVGLKVETNAGTFALTADSAVIATVADSIAVLPDPAPPSGKKHKPTPTKFWGLRSSNDTNTTFRFSRAVWDNRSDIELDLSNGAWETFEFLGDQAANVLSALRGTRVDTSDTAHVSVKARSSQARECKDWLLGFRNDAGFAPFCFGHFEHEASPLAGNPAPRYPSALQYAGVSGKVIMQFVIDTLGQVDRRTIYIAYTSDPRFAMAVLEVLPQARFQPAVVDGRKVKELVETPYVFNMRRR
jgi:protein TonB